MLFLMKRHQILQALNNYKTTFDEERNHVPRFVNLISNFQNSFERSLEFGHITGSAWITDAQGKSALLVHHKKLNRWLQPGGHADGDENILNVATKEAREETGLQSLILHSKDIFDIDTHTIPAYKNTPAHEHYDIRFHFVADPSETYTVSHESNKLAWVSMEKIPFYTNQSNSILRMVSKTKMIFNPATIL